MPSLRGHLPLAVVSIVLSVAVYILFKELRAVKSQAAIGANFAASSQQQQQQQLQMFQHMPPQFVMEHPPAELVPTPETPATEEGQDDDGALEDLEPAPTPRPKSKLQQKRQ
jgi:type II secretory pathway pseudopilin PulG